MLLDLYFLMAEGLRPKTSLTKQTGAVWRALVAQLQEEVLLTQKEKGAVAKYVPKYKIVRKKAATSDVKQAVSRETPAKVVVRGADKPAIIRWERIDFRMLIQHYGVLRLEVSRQAEQDEEEDLLLLLTA